MVLFRIASICCLDEEYSFSWILDCLFLFHIRLLVVRLVPVTETISSQLPRITPLKIMPPRIQSLDGLPLVRRADGNVADVIFGPDIAHLHHRVSQSAGDFLPVLH